MKNGMFCKSLIVFLSLAVLVFQSSFELKNVHKLKLEIYIARTIKTLENVVDFYVKNVDKVNLDSVYGLRVAEGSLRTILLSVDRDNQHFRKLHALHNTMMTAAEKSLPYLMEYQSNYYNEFKPIVDKPWTIFDDFRRLKNKSTLSNGHVFRGKSFDEKSSDKCMSEMIGTGAHDTSPCHVSLDCLKLMTNSKTKRYGNTHQILYFLLGDQTGCRHIVEKEFQKFWVYRKKKNVLNVDNFLEQKCQQILVEMNALKENVVANGDTDLFLEQGLVCGILGYEEFLHFDILENIFLWQDKEYGCFGTETSHFEVKPLLLKIISTL